MGQNLEKNVALEKKWRKLWKREWTGLSNTLCSFPWCTLNFCVFTCNRWLFPVTPRSEMKSTFIMKVFIWWKIFVKWDKKCKTERDPEFWIKAGTERKKKNGTNVRWRQRRELKNQLCHTKLGENNAGLN